MNKNLFKNLIEKAENENNGRLIIETLQKYHPYDVAAVFLEMGKDDREIVYATLTDSELAVLFTYVDAERAAGLFDEISNRRGAAIIEALAPDDATDILINLKADKKQAIINLLKQETRIDIERLTLFEEDDAGSIMTTDYVAIESGKDVKDIMRAIVKTAPDVETINTSFVVDKTGKLLGTLDLKQIIITKSPCLVDNIMNVNFHCGNVNDNKEDIIRLMQNYDIDVLPILEAGILKGIITGDDAMDSYIEEAEEDYARLGGLTDSEELTEPTFVSVRKRLPWLIVLLIINIFIALLMSFFDYLYETLTVLVVFQPIILGMAGNSGTQTLAISIQKITKNKLNDNNKILKHMGKEAVHGLGLGIFFGILAFFLTGAVLFLAHDFAYPLYKIGLIVAVSIFVSLFIANFAGALIPVVFHKLKIDPTAASGPFITTIIDITSVLIYFLLASLLIQTNL